MNVTERNELAADIARRVRMYTWQPMPQALLDVLPDGRFLWTPDD